MEKISFLAQFRRRIDGLYKDGILPKYFKAPVFVLWELTNNCNLSCIHCYYNANHKEKRQELTTSQAFGIIDQLAELKVFEAYLTGGEALLRPDWPELIKRLREKKIQVGIISNGTQIDKAAAKILASLKVKWVQISIDGASPEVHDKVRGLAGGWEKSVAAIRYLRENNIRTHVSFVPTKINFRDVKKVIALCVEMGLEYFVTDMLVLTGRAALNFDNVKLNAEEYTEFFSLLEEAAKVYTDKLMIIAPSREKETIKTYVKTRSAAPNIWCIITPEGSCRLDLLLPFTYGDLKKQSIAHVWDNFLKQGWNRPEVVEFIDKLNMMSDLVNNQIIPYVSSDIHSQ